jgi:uncharacterized protein (TIGR02001 family)
MANRFLTGLAALCAAVPAAQAVEVSGNAGYLSEYIFRGIPQDDSSAMGGLDVTHEGFYAGTWAADVGLGLEVDVYGGYGGEIGDIRYSIGATGYLYTDDFDDDYREANVSLGWKFLSVAAAFGKYDNFAGPTEDYTYVAPRIDYAGFYALAGIFSRDFDGEYYEAGYGNTFEPIGVDYTVSAIYSTDKLLSAASGETNLVLSVKKSFDIYGDKGPR